MTLLLTSRGDGFLLSDSDRVLGQLIVEAGFLTAPQLNQYLNEVQTGRRAPNSLLSTLQMSGRLSPNDVNNLKVQYHQRINQKSPSDSTSATLQSLIAAGVLSSEKASQASQALANWSRQGRKVDVRAALLHLNLASPTQIDQVLGVNIPDFNPQPAQQQDPGKKTEVLSFPNLDTPQGSSQFVSPIPLQGSQNVNMSSHGPANGFNAPIPGGTGRHQALGPQASQPNSVFNPLQQSQNSPPAIFNPLAAPTPATPPGLQTNSSNKTFNPLAATSPPPISPTISAPSPAPIAPAKPFTPPPSSGPKPAPFQPVPTRHDASFSADSGPAKRKKQKAKVNSGREAAKEKRERKKRESKKSGRRKSGGTNVYLLSAAIGLVAILLGGSIVYFLHIKPKNRAYAQFDAARSTFEQDGLPMVALKALDEIDTRYAPPDLSDLRDAIKAAIRLRTKKAIGEIKKLIDQESENDDNLAEAEKVIDQTIKESLAEDHKSVEDLKQLVKTARTCKSIREKILKKEFRAAYDAATVLRTEYLTESNMEIREDVENANRSHLRERRREIIRAAQKNMTQARELLENLRRDSIESLSTAIDKIDADLRQMKADLEARKKNENQFQQLEQMLRARQYADLWSIFTQIQKKQPAALKNQTVARVYNSLHAILINKWRLAIDSAQARLQQSGKIDVKSVVQRLALTGKAGQFAVVVMMKQTPDGRASPQPELLPAQIAPAFVAGFLNAFITQRLIVQSIKTDKPIDVEKLVAACKVNIPNAKQEFFAAIGAAKLQQGGQNKRLLFIRLMQRAGCKKSFEDMIQQIKKQLKKS